MLLTNSRLKHLLYKLSWLVRDWRDAARLHPVRERAVRALHGSVDYIESHLPDAIGFRTPREALAYAVSECRVAGQYLEFGVFKGHSLRYLARLKPGADLHGFDSFQGLPEAWAGFGMGRGALTAHGRLPRVPAHVRLHVGWFADTLPVWRRETSEPVAFIHVDCDIYSSTAELLAGVAGRLQAGTVIVFDEYFNYPNWEKHEFRAWQEFVRERRVRYEYLAFSRHQAVVRILEFGVGPP